MESLETLADAFFPQFLKLEFIMEMDGSTPLPLCSHFPKDLNENYYLV